ncbi:hypothetical protein [Spirillospora sp. NPDC029432]|uniref:hypothetical protein n=1 Tax=Spirillospora sp. NPDC029432 TaxID=3154599 RepID=UPI003451483D
MGLVIRYSVTIAEDKPAGGLLGAVASAAASVPGLPSFGLPVTVSNDVFGGSLILDAEITVAMAEGPSADRFEVTLAGLPGSTVERIRSTIASTPLRLTVTLGYFDEPGSGRKVIEGRVLRVAAWVADDGRTRVRLTGQEAGGYALRTTKAAQHLAGSATADEFARRVAKAAGVSLAPGSELPVPLRAFTVRAPNALGALGELAAAAEAPIVVRDQRVLLGAAVGGEKAPVAFDPAVNLVALGDGQHEETRVREPDDDEPPPVHTAVKLTALGHPGLRAGQVATVEDVDDVPSGPLRVAEVVHRFGAGTGYVCDVTLVAARAGRLSPAAGGARGMLDTLRARGERDRMAAPDIDVGDVTKYTRGGHRVTMKYGQSPAPGSASPSVTDPVDDDAVLHEKPVAAPFAFGPCGLMTPVYPGMRALLAHNRGLVNDAAVVGYLWRRTPGAPAPEPRAGDYWLALPTRLGPDGMPDGPGVNDLTDASGRRIVQARGLRIVVGTGLLPTVGTRPDPPADDSITIEHHTGTTITVTADGEVTVATKGKKIMFTNEAVRLTLDKSSVAVS